MVQITRNAALTRAITRAKSEDLHVKAIEFGQYQVTNHTHQTSYIVRLRKENGVKLAECSCKAGRVSLLCKHVAVAVPLHVHLASSRTK
jgi:ketopantoate hydroxymethyltransferase